VGGSGFLDLRIANTADIRLFEDLDDAKMIKAILHESRKRGLGLDLVRNRL